MPTQEGRSQEFFGRIAGKEARLPSHFTSFYLLARMSLDISIPCKNYFKEPYSKNTARIQLRGRRHRKSLQREPLLFEDLYFYFRNGFPEGSYIIKFFKIYCYVSTRLALIFC